MNLPARIHLIPLVLLVPLSCADILGIKEATLQTTVTYGGSGNGGGTSSTGGSGGASGGDGCGMNYKTECLQTCYDTNCCAEQAACDDDAECSALLNCAVDCPNADSKCISACQDAHGAGYSLLSDMVTCGNDHCSMCPDAVGDAAIATFASAACAKYQACNPVSFSISHGTMAQCIARSELANRWIYQLPGATWTASAFTDCAKAWTSASCEDYLNGKRTAACTAPGLFAIGAACNSSFECQSLLCDTDGTFCGQCVASPTEGSPCVRGSCSAGLVCADDSTCQRARGLGESCGDALPCVLPLACYQGTCVNRQSTVGAACDTESGLYCDFYKSMTCYTSEKKCVSITEFADLGVGCGVGTDGTATLCAKGTCQSGTQKCVALAADGAACDDSKGPYCEWPASCIDGICQLESDLANCASTE